MLGLDDVVAASLRHQVKSDLYRVDLQSFLPVYNWLIELFLWTKSLKVSN
jgi:hypothetical protein